MQFFVQFVVFLCHEVKDDLFLAEAVEKRSPTFEKQERDERTLCFKNISHQIFASQAESLYRGVKAVHLARNTRNNKPTGSVFNKILNVFLDYRTQDFYSEIFY